MELFMKISCARKFQFAMAHRIFEHEGECARLHGHNYTMWVYFTSDKLDDKGRVIDFSSIKNKIGEWINKYFDHQVLVYENDKEMLSKVCNPIIFPTNCTAENMAIYCLIEFNRLFSDNNLTINKITLFETDNCIAEVEMEDGDILAIRNGAENEIQN